MHETRKCDGIKVAIVDATRMGSDSIAAVLRKSHCDIVYAGTSAENSYEKFAHADIGLISAALDGEPGKGYDLAQRIHKDYPRVQVILMVDHYDPHSVVRAFRSGARGIFSRDASPQLLTKCVPCVYNGQVWTSNEGLRHLVEALVAPPRLRLVNSVGAEILAPREQEVVHWVAEGLSNREIADKMGLSENTVKNYMFRIFEKLGISNRVELILYAVTQMGDGSPATPRATTETRVANTDQRAISSFDERVFMESLQTLSDPYYVLGETYDDARDVNKHAPTALMWFLVAERISQEFAGKIRVRREQLERTLPPEDVATARHRSEELFRKSRMRPRAHDITSNELDNTA